MEELQAKHPYFPMFIDSREKSVLVVGGGKVATRRVQSLLQFCFRVTVVSPKLSDELRGLAETGDIEHIQDRFSPGHLAGMDMVCACTDDRKVNQQIGEACRQQIPVNVCDAREESEFWFPAIALNEELTMGLVGNGQEHGTVRKAAAVFRRIIIERSYIK